MKPRANAEIKEYAKSKNVMLWQIGDEIHKSEPAMSRWLRYELSQEDKELFINAVDTIASQRG